MARLDTCGLLPLALCIASLACSGSDSDEKRPSPPADAGAGDADAGDAGTDGGSGGHAGGAGASGSAGVGGGAGMAGAGGDGGDGGSAGTGSDCPGVDTLSDPDNCGTCGHDCQGAACTNGQCEPEVLVSGLQMMIGIAVDDAWAYWLENNLTMGSIAVLSRVAKAGGTPQVLATKTGSAQALVVLDDHVYWASCSSGGYEGIVYASPVAGGPPSVVAEDLPCVTKLATDGTALYWADEDSGGGHRIMKLELPDGTPQALPTGGEAYVAGLAAGTSGVFWTGRNDALPAGSYAIFRIDDGAVSSTVFSDASFSMALAVGGGYVAWTEINDGNLRYVPTAGGTPITSSQQNRPWYVVLDDDAVYWVNNDWGGEVMRRSLNDGKELVLASNQGTPAYIAVDDGAVYWLDLETYALLRVAK